MKQQVLRKRAVRSLDSGRDLDRLFLHGPLGEATLAQLARLAPHVARLPAEKLWLDYDREADVLYVSFRRPQDATDSEMLDNGVLVRYCGDQVVGVTILDASKR